MSDKYYSEDNEELSKIVNKESLLSKFIKAGIVASTVYVTSKKANNTKFGEFLKNDFVKAGLIAAGTYTLSNDDNVGGDMLSASSFVFGISAIKTLKDYNGTVEGFSKIQNKLLKLDSLESSISSKIFNFGDKVKETFGDSFSKRTIQIQAEYQSKNIEPNELYKNIRIIGTSIYDTVTAPIENFKKLGLVDGLKENIKNIDNTSVMRAYNSLNEEDKGLFKYISNISRNFTDTKIFKDDVGFIADKANGLFKKITGVDGLFGKEDIAFNENAELLKKIDKIHSIKTNTTFSDIGGLYTKYDSVTNKLKLNLDNIGNSEASNIELLESLANKFKNQAQQELGNTVIKNPLTNEKEFVAKFDVITDEQKEKMFLNWLNKNGFKEFVDNNYNKKDALTIGDIDLLFRDKTVKSNEQLKEIEERLKLSFEKNLIDEDVYNKRMSMINERKAKFADNDIIDYIQNTFNQSSIKKFLDVNEEEGFVYGVKNNEFLKNFTFTNVVRKSKEFGYIDETALDGNIAILKTIGILEKNFVGFFKLPFTKSLNRWNPLKLAETENRIKNIVANEYNPYGLSGNGYIINGKIIQSQEYIAEDINELGEIAVDKNGKVKYKNYIDFFSDEKSSYKRTFLKSHIDTLDENYEVLKSNQKYNNSYTSIYKTFKEKGLKEALEKASKSHFNPLPIRYDKNIGIIGVNPEEGYFNENPIWSGIYNNNLTNNSILNKLNAKNKKTGALRRTANLILGEQGDINGRILKIDNDFIESRYDNILDFVIAQTSENTKRRYQLNVNNPNIIKSFFPNGFKNATKEQAIAFNKAMSGLPLINLGEKVFKLNSFDIFTTLEKKAENKESLLTLINNIKLALSDNSKVLYSGKSIEKYIDIQANANKDVLKFVQDNKKDLLRLVGLSEYRFAYKNGMIDGKNQLFDLKSVSDELKIFFNKKNEELGIDNRKHLYSLMDEIISYTKKNEEIFYDSSKYNSVEYKKAAFVLNNRIINIDQENQQRLSTILENSKSFLTSVDKAKNRVETDLIKELLKNQLIQDTKIGSKIKNIIKNRAFGTEEIRDAYNINLGYSYNKVLNNENNKMIFDFFNEISSSYKKSDAYTKVQNLDQTPWDYNFAKKLTNTNKDYSKTEIGSSLRNTFKNNDNTENLSYSFFNKIDEGARLDKEDLNVGYFKAVELFRANKYTTRKTTLGSSLIVEDSLKSVFEVKSALDATRTFVQSMIEKNQKAWIRRKNLTRFDDDFQTESSLKVKGKTKYSKNFGEVDSTFGLFMKKAINQVQGPLEFIGIERLTNEALGSHWTDHYKNFMKYRYLPLAALITGYLAIDSASDAIIPDEVPIVGNGITGVVTRTYAAGRVGLQYGLKYTGLLSAMRAIDNVIPIDNGLTWFLDPLMNPEEMIDIYFHGKPIRVNKNRNWYTAGRQTGEGEEFDSYRPHLLYTLGNPTSGIYDNKFEKFFRQDFLLSKYPWYLLDPYREEREAYKKFGAIYPKTEQMFTDIPLIGNFMSATIGEAIKPTQYIGEELWKVGNNLMKNPGYNPNNPSSPEYIKFQEPNKMLMAVFDAIEDYKTFAGMHGYLLGKITEAIFGDTNPYSDDVVLDSIDNDISMVARYERLQAGGMFGTTEGIRRLLDGDSLGTIKFNPLKQNLPEWMPEFFKKGKNPYMKADFGEYTLPGEAFEETYGASDNKELNIMRILSMHAPYSKPFLQLKDKLYKNFDNLSQEEQKFYLENLSYANQYGKRAFNDEQGKATNIIKQNLKIDKKISPTEFISNGKRYKIDNIEDDFNKLSEKLGSDKASKLISQFNERITEGESYQFSVSSNAVYSVGTDKDGDFIRVASNLVDKSLKGDSVYNRNGTLLKTLSLPFSIPFNRMISNPMPSHLEKIFGKKTAYEEWSQETVEAPYFRDWDNPISSFVEPFFNYSSNHITSAILMSDYVNEAFINSNATLNGLGALNNLGKFNLIKNMLTGNVTRSSQYENESIVHKELEKIKAIAGDKSYFNMNGHENLKQLENMVNENDSKFLEGLINTTNISERAKILKTADSITSNVLKTVWNRHQKLIDNKNSDNIYEIEKEKITDVIDIGAYIGNIDQARLALKTSLNVSHSKLDNKRLGVIKSYRGGMSMAEANYIKERMYRNYNSKSFITSTIYPKGNINISRREN